MIHWELGMWMSVLASHIYFANDKAVQGWTCVFTSCIFGILLGVDS